MSDQSPRRQKSYTRPGRVGSAPMIVAGVVSVILVAGVLALAAINPYALLGLPAALLAVAKIIRAITNAGLNEPGPKRGRAGRS